MAAPPRNGATPAAALLPTRITPGGVAEMISRLNQTRRA